MDFSNISRRSLAYLIDSLLAFGFYVLTQRWIFVPLRGFLFGSDEWFASGLKTELYTLVTISLPIWLYFTLTEVSGWQSTIGKKWLKLQTIDAASRERIFFWQSFLRTVIKLLPWEVAHLAANLPVPMWYDPEPGFRLGFILSPVLLVLYISLAVLSSNRQSLHDMIAKTLVVVRK